MIPANKAEGLSSSKGDAFTEIRSSIYHSRKNFSTNEHKLAGTYHEENVGYGSGHRYDREHGWRCERDHLHSQRFLHGYYELYECSCHGEKTSSSTNGRIYVYSYDNVSTDEYTNHFRGQEVNGSSRTTRGSKWVTQRQEIPIENANIVSPKYYSVSARGNTNYSNYDGISRITLGGYFLANK